MNAAKFPSRIYVVKIIDNKRILSQYLNAAFIYSVLTVD